MDLQQIRYFLDLSQSLHFGKTATSQNITPSLLTRSIQKLEEEVGSSLFYRTNRNVKLSQAGNAFRLFALDYVQKWTSLTESLAQKKDLVSGEISIFLTVTACYSVLPKILNVFRQKYPDVHLKLQTGDDAEALGQVSSKNFDFAIAALPEKLKSSLDFMVLTETPIVFIAEKNYRLSFHKNNEIDFSKTPIILPEFGLARHRLDKWFLSKNIIPDIYAQVSGNEGIIGLVSLGSGIGAVPRLVFENSPIKNKIKIITTPTELEAYRVGIAVEESRLKNRAVREFWELTKEQASLF